MTHAATHTRLHTAAVKHQASDIKYTKTKICTMWASSHEFLYENIVTAHENIIAGIVVLYLNKFSCRQLIPQICCRSITNLCVSLELRFCTLLRPLGLVAVASRIYEFFMCVRCYKIHLCGVLGPLLLRVARTFFRQHGLVGAARFICLLFTWVPCFSEQHATLLGSLGRSLLQSSFVKYLCGSGAPRLYL